MNLVISILLSLVALICFLGGTNIMLKGASNFLPKDLPIQLVLDNLVRFLSGIYIGAGFLFAYASIEVATIGSITYFLGIIVIFSGMGRLFSRIKVGSAGNYFDIIMIVEILLGLSIIIFKYLA